MASSIRTQGPLSLRLEAPAIVGGGQPVPLRIVMTNISNDTLTIAVPDHAFFQTDIKITQWSMQIWHKLRHHSCGCAALEWPLAPHDSVVFRDLWPQRTNHHWPVAPGKYTVIATVDEEGVNRNCCGIQSAPIQIRVR